LLVELAMDCDPLDYLGVGVYGIGIFIFIFHYYVEINQSSKGCFNLFC